MRKLKKIFIFLGVFICIAACKEQVKVDPIIYNCGLSEEVTSEHSQAVDFQNIIEKALEITPSVQAAVTSTNGQKWLGSAGYADLSNKSSLENCHRFMIASISKVVTATMIFQLQDEGVLSIDDPLTDWLSDDILKDVPNVKEVNLVNLLNHTSGIPDMLNTRLFYDGTNDLDIRFIQLDRLDYVRGLKADFNTGEQFGYSNTNYLLLGLVVEAARNMKIWDAVNQYVAMPLGLNRFVMGTINEPMPVDCVRPYAALNGGRYVDITKRSLAEISGSTGHGGIATNMQDLNLFFEALFTGQLISEEALEQMTRNVINVDEDDKAYPDWGTESYGYGIIKYETPKGIAYGHTGSISSFNSFSLFFPENNAALSIIYNGSPEDGEDDIINDIRNELVNIMVE